MIPLKGKTEKPNMQASFIVTELDQQSDLYVLDLSIFNNPPYAEEFLQKDPS